MRNGGVCRGAAPYSRVMGPATLTGQATPMTGPTARILACSTVMAMLLALGTMASVAAQTVTRDQVAERYAHSLLNCTRSGGLVRPDGTCASRGSGQYSTVRAPLRLNGRLSLRVAWPWARTMVRTGACEHVIPGRPTLTARMRNGGFRTSSYGENIGCAWGSGDTQAVVLATHRAMQAERSVDGGHWQNIKDAAYGSVGIGVASGGGRVMVVWDFLGRRS
jgi:hypothetical protein